MRKIDRIMEKLRKSKPLVEKKYGVKNHEVFGSYIRGEQKKGSNLFKYIELENFLSKKLGVKVDLVIKDTLKLRIKDRILKEVVSV